MQLFSIIYTRVYSHIVSILTFSFPFFFSAKSLFFDDAELFAYAIEMVYLKEEHLSHNQDVVLFLGDAIYYLREINKRFNLNQISSEEYLILILALVAKDKTKDFWCLAEIIGEEERNAGLQVSENIYHLGN